MYIYKLIISISLYIYIYIELPPSLCVCVCVYRCKYIYSIILDGLFTTARPHSCSAALLPFTPPLYHSFLPLLFPLFFTFFTTRTWGQAYAAQKRGYYSSTPTTRHLLTSLPPPFFVKKKQKNKRQDKLRDPETGLLLEYSHYGTSSPAPRNNHARIGRLPLILAGIYIKYKSDFDLYYMQNIGVP